MQEMWVWSLGQEDPLEEEMTTHSSILAWEIQEQRSLDGYSPWGHKRVRYDLATKQHMVWVRQYRHSSEIFTSDKLISRTKIQQNRTIRRSQKRRGNISCQLVIGNLSWVCRKSAFQKINITHTHTKFKSSLHNNLAQSINIGLYSEKLCSYVSVGIRY